MCWPATWDTFSSSARSSCASAYGVVRVAETTRCDAMEHRPLPPGVTLHNLQLRVEALEYLQLPVTIKEGCIGRLSLTLPLRALYSRPIVVSIHDLVLHVGPRSDEEWHPELAAQRAGAAKQVLHTPTRRGRRGMRTPHTQHCTGGACSQRGTEPCSAHGPQHGHCARGQARCPAKGIWMVSTFDSNWRVAPQQATPVHRQRTHSL